MTMKMKFWKNPNVAEAKKLAKLPEYKQFTERMTLFRQFHEHKNFHVRAYSSGGPNIALFESINKLEERLGEWKPLADAIYLQEIENTKGHLKEDAETLLAKAEIKDEQSKPMVLLEETDKSQRRKGKHWIVAGVATLATSIVLSVIVMCSAGTYPNGGLKISPPMMMIFEIALAIIPLGYACVGIGSHLKNMFSSTLQTLKKAIGAANGVLEKQEYKKINYEIKID